MAVAEIEKHPNQVLAHHYPTVPNLGDVSRMTEADVAALGQIDIVVFGSPCQDLSVAGKRKGLDGERSGLFFVAMRIVEWARKHCGLRWALWENVPGAFTSAAGADFAAVVDHMVGLEIQPPAGGWETEGAALGSEGLLEWSTLDAQWFGVAQRRRRVFALADFGNWSGRPPILLEPEGLRGDSAPSRVAREAVAGAVDGSIEKAVSWWNGSQVSQTLDAVLHKGQMMPEKNRFPVVLASCSPATAESANAAVNLFATPAESTTQTAPAPDQGRTTSTPTRNETGYCGHIESNDVIAFPANLSGTQHASTANVACSLGAKNPVAVVGPNLVARRITPVEAERLQGFPDNYTLVAGAKDSPRYKALGNSMAVPVMRWIGTQIDFAHVHF